MSGSGNQVCFAPLAPLPFTPHASAPPPAPAGTLSVPAIEVDRAKYQEVMGDYLRRTFWAPYEWRVFSDVRSSEISYQVARVGFYLIPISITERPFVVSAPSPIPIGSTSCPQGHLSFDPLIGYTCKTFTYGRFERFLNVTPSTVPLPSYVFALPATCSLL